MAGQAMAFLPVVAIVTDHSEPGRSNAKRPRESYRCVAREADEDLRSHEADEHRQSGGLSIAPPQDARRRLHQV